MAKGSAITAAGEPIHTRTTGAGAPSNAESTVVVLGLDGSDTVLGNATDGIPVFLSATDRALIDGIESKLDAISAQLPSVLGIGGGLKVEGSAGEDCKSFISTALVLADFVKATPGVVTGMEFYKISAGEVFIRLYNKTTAPTPADVPVWRGVIPGSSAGAGGYVKTFLNGLNKFPSGIAVRISELQPDNDATPLVANDVIGNIEFI